MGLNNWIEFYIKKGGSFSPEIPFHSEFVFDEKDGFCLFYIDTHPLTSEVVVYVDATCGNGKRWLAYVVEYAKKHYISKILTYTNRNRDAYIRRFNCKCIAVDEDRYLMEKEIE